MNFEHYLYNNLRNKSILSLHVPPPLESFVIFIFFISSSKKKGKKAEGDNLINNETLSLQLLFILILQ